MQNKSCEKHFVQCFNLGQCPITSFQIAQPCLQQVNLTWACDTIQNQQFGQPPWALNLSPQCDQQILCFDRCQLTITWTSNIKERHYKPNLYVSVNLHCISRNVGAILCNSVIAMIIVVYRHAFLYWYGAPLGSPLGCWSFAITINIVIYTVSCTFT